MLMQVKRVLREADLLWTAGLKLPTETIAFEDPREKDTFSNAEAHSRGPTNVQASRKSGQQKLLH